MRTFADLSRSSVPCAAFFLLCLAVSCFGQRSSVPASALVEAPSALVKIRSALLEKIEQDEIPSLAVAVVKDGEVIWEEGLGWANREEKTGATPNTLYAVASVSKSITASGVITLVERDKLTLNDIVWSYPGKPGDRESGRITIAQLLNHTSGIPHLFQYEFSDSGAEVFSRIDLIQLIGFIAAKPGSRFIYSNLGYAVLARKIEEAGGDNLQGVMSRMLFGPLGMRQTTLDGWVGGNGTAAGYDDKGARLNFRYRLGPDGGAGYFSSLSDLVLYSKFHLGEDVPEGFSKVPISRSLPSEVPANGFSYDRGWGIIRDSGLTFLISDGQMAGATAAMVLVPEERMAVVVLCNKTGGPALESAISILGSVVSGTDITLKSKIGQLEREFTRPGEVPEGTFSGVIVKHSAAVPVTVEFEEGRPVVYLARKRYRADDVEWNRGTMQFSIKASIYSRPEDEKGRRLIFSVWSEDKGLSGYVQEEFIDDRPRSGLPYLLRIRKDRETDEMKDGMTRVR